MKWIQGWMGVLAMTACFVGCGGSAETTAPSDASGSSTTTSANTIPPNEIVAMFADSIRRGDRDAASRLITKAARDEIQRRGFELDPPGSPDASYKIGEFKFVDEDKDAAYVESLWIEPGENGQPAIETEVVWAVLLEPEGWRISGLAIDQGKETDMLIVDFENLEPTVSETASKQATASAPTGTPATTVQSTMPNTNGQSANLAMPNAIPTSTGFQVPPQSAPASDAGTPAGFSAPAIAAPPATPNQLR